jgi:hypothetical protein
MDLSTLTVNGNDWTSFTLTATDGDLTGSLITNGDETVVTKESDADIESMVKEQICLGQEARANGIEGWVSYYEGALKIITMYYRSEIRTPDKNYDYTMNDQLRPDAFLTDASTNMEKENARTIIYPIAELDKYYAGERSFGYIVRCLYHEHIHVAQETGWEGPGTKLYNHDEKEFKAHYFMVLNNQLPYMTLPETYYYIARAFLYFNNLSLLMQRQYSSQCQQIEDYQFHLLNE